MRQWHKIYPNLITIENLFRSYYEFKKGKKKNADLLTYERNLEDNLFELYKKLKSKRYRPGIYTGFYINDPKVRLIHKASIEDRVVHHLVGKKIEEIFEPTYIAHSYACRNRKGTHKGVLDLQRFARKVSKNNTKACFALKCDIKKFFASINHAILYHMLSRRVKDKDFLKLLKKIIDSFHSGKTCKGLPIGNLTSQHFANIYLNELDQFMKHVLKVKYYLRYTDDFIILSSDKKYLTTLLVPIKTYLEAKLDIELHPKKIKFLNLYSGIDFLGYVVFPYHILPRGKNRKSIIRKIKKKIREYKSGKTSSFFLNQTVQSYLGYLSHCNAYKLSQEIKHLVININSFSDKSEASKKPRIQEPKEKW